MPTRGSDTSFSCNPDTSEAILKTQLWGMGKCSGVQKPILIFWFGSKPPSGSYCRMSRVFQDREATTVSTPLCIPIQEERITFKFYELEVLIARGGLMFSVTCVISGPGGVDSVDACVRRTCPHYACVLVQEELGGDSHRQPRGVRQTRHVHVPLRRYAKPHYFLVWFFYHPHRRRKRIRPEMGNLHCNSFAQFGPNTDSSAMWMPLVAFFVDKLFGQRAFFLLLFSVTVTLA